MTRLVEFIVTAADARDAERKVNSKIKEENLKVISVTEQADIDIQEIEEAI